MASMLPQQNINVSFKNNFRLALSNVPNVLDFGDLRFLYDANVVAITIPDYNQELITSHYQNKVAHSPISKSNDALSDILIEFKIDEKFLNYYNLFKFMRDTKRGEPRAPDTRITPRARMKAEQYIRNYDIESVNVTILNGQQIPVAVMKFKNAFITSLSTVSLSFSDAEENTFTVNLKYRDIELELV